MQRVGMPRGALTAGNAVSTPACSLPCASHSLQPCCRPRLLPLDAGNAVNSNAGHAIGKELPHPKGHLCLLFVYQARPHDNMNLCCLHIRTACWLPVTA
jgi:hypothetical protein